MYELNVNKYKTKVFLCDDGNWRHDTIFIYNDSKCIAEKEIETIIEYLFNEGFIKDRRTKYYISERNSDK
tara:strand:+ start:557 stop:766 length:210 start_codon:yes stop_codon:yes gene_type:complete